LSAEFLKQFNWVDVVVLILVIRGIIRGAKNGIVLEFFSLIGWCLALYLSLKFYKPIASNIYKRTEIPLVLNEIFVFGGIMAGTILVANFIGNIFKHIVKIKVVEKISLWGGMVLGMLKGLVILSSLFYLLGILEIPYLDNSIKERSLSGRMITKVSEIVYQNMEEIFPIGK